MLLGIRLSVPEPRDVQIVVPGLDLLASEAAESTTLALIFTLRLPKWVVSNCCLELSKVSHRERAGLSERGHVVSEVVDPDRICVGLVRRPSLEEQHVRLDALGV